MAPGWSLDNYRRELGEWVPKASNEYISTFDFDDNNDGRSDGTLSAFTYALRYEHRVHSGVIWLREVPISAKLRDKDLRILMQSYVDEITSSSYEVVRLDSTTAAVLERRYAAAVIEQGPVTIAGRPGYFATVDVANLDQLRVSPDARARRVQLVIFRAPKDETLDADPRRRRNPQTGSFPVLIVAGYSNLPTDFTTSSAASPSQATPGFLTCRRLPARYAAAWDAAAPTSTTFGRRSCAR
jgi:hypothetical protein